MWQNQERLPNCNLKTLFSNYMDITTPPSQTLLALLGAHAKDDEDKAKLKLLATVKNLKEKKKKNCVIFFPLVLDA